MRFLILDIRRLFSRKGMLFLCVLAPLIVMLLFASIVAPLLYTGRGLHFKLALFQEDNSVEVRAFIFQLVHSHAMESLITLYSVDSLQEGLSMLDRQEVSVVLHIPPDVLEDIRAQKPVTIRIFGTPEHALEQSLIQMTLGQSLLLVGHGQNQMEAARQFVLTKGVPQGDADRFLHDMTYEALAQYMMRRQILGESGTLSPLGEYLPVEYYLAAVFTLFAAFAMLPLIHFTSSDLSGSILRRGLASGHGILKFFLARLASGTLFILLVLLMVFPTTILLGMADSFIGSAYHGNIWALVTTILLASLSLATLAAAIAAWVRKAQPAVWIGFYLVLGLAAASGTLVPDSALPSWLALVGRYLPLRSAMRGLAGALFSFDPAFFWPDMLKLLILFILLLPLGFAGFVRRGRGL